MDKKPGRPTKKTPELIGKLLEALSNGVHRKVAATTCGISSRTLELWVQADEELAERIEAVENEVEQKIVGSIVLAAANGDLKAAQWYLERRYPDRWGRRVVVSAEAPAAEGERPDWGAIMAAARQPRPRAS